MSWVAVGVAGAALVGGVMSSNAQKSAANKAANAQEAAAFAGIDEQRRQFDQIQALLSPYVSAGTLGLTGQKDLLGINGAEAQQTAVQALQESPEFQSQLKLGETSILSNASATGGLRGGNTQAALAQFSPQLLAQSINDRFSRLGGLVSVGQNAAAMTGNAGMQTGRGVSDLLQQMGAAQAGGFLAGGRAQAGYWNAAASGVGTFAGMGGFSGGYKPAPSSGGF